MTSRSILSFLFGYSLERGTSHLGRSGCVVVLVEIQAEAEKTEADVRVTCEHHEKLFHHFLLKDNGFPIKNLSLCRLPDNYLISTYGFCLHLLFLS